jgi:hypothetical protein
MFYTHEVGVTEVSFNKKLKLMYRRFRMKDLITYIAKAIVDNPEKEVVTE